MKPLIILLFFIANFNSVLANNQNFQQEIKLCYEDVSVHPWITGDMKGFVIKQLQTVEKLSKVKFKYIRLPWKRCQIEAMKGKIDGLIASSFTKSRTHWGVYPTFKNGNLNHHQRLHTDSFIVFKNKNSPILFENRKFINLGQNKIGVQLGYSVGTDLEDLGYPTYSSYSTADELIRALDSNKITIAILQNHATSNVLSENPILKNNIVKIFNNIMIT